MGMVEQDASTKIKDLQVATELKWFWVQNRPILLHSQQRISVLGELF